MTSQATGEKEESGAVPLLIITSSTITLLLLAIAFFTFTVASLLRRRRRAPSLPRGIWGGRGSGGGGSEDSLWAPPAPGESQLELTVVNAAFGEQEEETESDV